MGLRVRGLSGGITYFRREEQLELVLVSCYVIADHKWAAIWWLRQSNVRAQCTSSSHYCRIIQQHTAVRISPQPPSLGFKQALFVPQILLSLVCGFQ